MSGDLGDSVQPAETVAEASATETEASPVFTADHLPNQRHLYYQLCDLRSDSLQAVIHANDGQEEICSVRHFQLLSCVSLVIGYVAVYKG